MRSVINIDYGTDIATKAHRAYTALHTTTGIEHAVDIISTEAGEVADNGSESGRYVQTVGSKIDETAFTVTKG